VDSTIAAGFDDQVDLLSRTLALARMRAQDFNAFLRLAATFKRVGNILAKAREDGVQIGPISQMTDGWSEPAEEALASAVLGATQGHVALKETQDYDTILEVVSNLKPVVDTFFDEVMVMADDEKLRRRRLGLLAEVEKILLAVADFSKVQVDL
jgi:glycyl-tRNA synthetase beta chain